MNVPKDIKNILVAIFVMIGAQNVKKTGIQKVIKRNKIYSYDNGFDEVCFVLSLEDEDIDCVEWSNRYYDPPTFDIIDVLIYNKVITVAIDCLYEIKGLDYGNV